MKVLIIGGTGLISSTFVRPLMERGDAVTLYNRGLTANPFGPEVRVVRGDRREYAAFETLMRETGPFDCVYDMVGFVPEDAESVVRAFRGRIGQFVFCSTVDVYTKPAERLPYTEDHSRHAVGSYGQNKVRCEDILMEANARGDFPVTLLRPAATYGDGGGSLVHTFGWNTAYFDRLRKGKPVVTHGDGSSLWVACHAEDVGRAFLNAADNPRVFGKAYHLTGEEWLTWDRYHQTICRAMGWPEPRFVHIPTDLLVKAAPDRAAWCGFNFQYDNIFDNTAARTDLGFRYTIPFAEGARRTLEGMDACGRIADSDADPFDDRLIAAWEHLGEGMTAAMG